MRGSPKREDDMVASSKQVRAWTSAKKLGRCSDKASMWSARRMDQVETIKVWSYIKTQDSRHDLFHDRVDGHIEHSNIMKVSNLIKRCKGLPTPKPKNSRRLGSTKSMKVNILLNLYSASKKRK